MRPVPERVPVLRDDVPVLRVREGLPVDDQRRVRIPPGLNPGLTVTARDVSLLTAQFKKNVLLKKRA
jgi:hypothetical protein